ncbi:MAG TPA: NrfD/PsrC family molybdoenzyme membrane anchor subunit [Chthonomonadaceae bacterium]|nr:NrfD/PsrC family molybdoenzyme membrane anchor subunit [Chthonomonadaceae bacterium]
MQTEHSTQPLVTAAHRNGWREQFIEGDHTDETIGNKISNVVLAQKHPMAWFIAFGIGFLLLNILMVALGWLVIRGTGIWGINVPVGWGFAIINFVWWIGIGHAGTLISAILLLLRQRWRNSINRFAEAMTLFAVMCAGIFPLFHTGRPWVAYWLFPYPSVMGVWPQFRSPLVWDVFAVSTYITVSALFWFMGLIPDFATLRDRTRNRAAQVIFGILGMGWNGSAKHWQRYETAYLVLAGLSTPLVLSVHSIVSLDFAVSQIPGWHATIFPPYFVAGAVYAGFAMVLTLAIPVRAWYGMKDFITMRHIDWCAKIMLATGLVVFYAYIFEVFYAWYSGDKYEWFMIHNRMTGPYAVYYWMLIACNGVIPQILWWNKARHNLVVVFLISLVVSLGMWLERFVIIPVSLHRDFLPSSWGMYYPTFWDWMTYLGTFGLFTFMMFLFIRFVPMINIFEMKVLLREQEGGDHHDQGDGHRADGHAPVSAEVAGEHV